MRILFLSDLADPTRGSLIRQIHAGARELQRRGHEVALFATHREGPRLRRSSVAGFEVVEVRSRYPVRFRPLVGLSNPSVRGPLTEFLANHRPDCVHAHLLHTHLSWSALAWAKRSGAGVVYTAHDVMAFCYQKMDCFHGGWALEGRGTDWKARVSKCWPCQRLRFLPGRNRAIRHILERCVDVRSAVSHALAERLREHGIPIDAISPNAALDPPHEVGDEEREAFRQRYDLGSGPVLLFAGRVQAQKGILRVLDALAHLRGRFPGIRLLVASHSDLWERHARGHAESLGVLDLCRVTGWLAERELEAAYANASVLCSPSTCFETFGLVHLEAQRRGIPSIGSIYGGVPEVIADGATGRVVNPFSPLALENALSELLSDPTLARVMGERGRERAIREFSLAGMVDGWEELYEKALHAGSRARAESLQ